MEENKTVDNHSLFSSLETTSFANDTSSTNTISTKKPCGKPKSIVWGRYIKQGKEISKGHWNATCNFCGEFWYKGSPTILV